MVIDVHDVSGFNPDLHIVGAKKIEAPSVIR
jgi:hypothetical protein